jgi:hypothetical protein
MKFSGRRYKKINFPPDDDDDDDIAVISPPV